MMFIMIITKIDYKGKYQNNNKNNDIKNNINV